jgi:hypothetical protein
MEAGIQLKVLAKACVLDRLAERIHRRIELAQFGPSNLLGRPVCRGHLKQQPQGENLLEVVHRRLQDAHAAIALEANHALVGKLQQRFTHWRARYV